MLENSGKSSGSSKQEKWEDRKRSFSKRKGKGSHPQNKRRKIGRK